MGSNGRKKGEENKPEPASAVSEFDRDVFELTERAEIHCLPDICAAEYQKALSLLEAPMTKENIQRCYSIMWNLAIQFEYVPSIMWMGDYEEFVVDNPEEAAHWYKKAADMGDGKGARCYADMLIAGKGVERNMQLAMQFYSLAANKGIDEAAFVMGEFHRNNGERENALKAYQQAVNDGYAPAQTRIDQMKSGQR